MDTFLGILPIVATSKLKALTTNVVKKRAEKLAGKYIRILNDSTIFTILNLIAKVIKTTKRVCQFSPLVNAF